MKNIKNITTSAFIKATSIILDSQLIKFNWSPENKFFMELKINTIINEAKNKFECVFKPYNDIDLIILHGEVTVLFGKNTPLPLNFQLSDSHPIVSMKLGDNPTKMGLNHFNENKSHYKQDISEIDIVHVMVKYLLTQIKYIKASIETEYVIKHFVTQLEKDNLKLMVDKNINL